MPKAIQAGMDCQTFWRSNPKRLNQFCEARGYAEDIDLSAWATGYYVALAFAGKFPKSPDLLNFEPAETEQSIEDEAEKMALHFEAWTQVNNQRFKKNSEEVTQDG